MPGGSLAAGYLSGLADALAAAGFRAIRVNPRGAGGSTGPMQWLTLHDYAGVIEGLDVAPAFVLGHAFGNRVARTVAADRPDLVRGVILVAAGGKVDPRPEAQHALRTLFTPASSETEILDAMGWMVGSPQNAASVWERFRPAARPQPRRRRWRPPGPRSHRTGGPPGDIPYLVIQGLADEAAPAENGHLLK